MKVALAQLNYHIGNLQANTHKIKHAITQAKAEGADLVVFSEMSICGYLPNDLLFYNDFISRCEQAADDIRNHCQGIACIIGLPVRNTVPAGKDLYNAAWFIHDGEVIARVHKGLLPTYDVFDEYRYFEPGNTFNCIQYKGYKIALTICEDLWNVKDDNPLYTFQPMQHLAAQQPDVMINIAASPFSYLHDDERMRVLGENCRVYNLPLLYVNAVGGNTELLFDGGSMVMCAGGNIYAEMSYCTEQLAYFQLQDVMAAHNCAPRPSPPADVVQIHRALVMGIQDYFNKSGFAKAVIGLSGGIDSAVVCALAAEALGPQNVLAVLMPSKYSSTHSIADAEALVTALGCGSTTVPIQPAAQAFDDMLSADFAGLPADVTEENIQARIRGTLLMAFSNKQGYILLNTSNKSEAAVGYGTLYGDMAGAISVIGDLYKLQVYELARHINAHREIIPENTIVKPPSAELRPDQKDSDSLPPYEVLDKILFAHIEEMLNHDQIVALGFDSEVVTRVLKLVKAAEFKRRQAPPILRVSPKAFGIGRRVPIVAKY